VRVERRSVESSEESSLGGDSTVEGFDMGIERSSLVPVIVGSLATVTAVFFLNWSKCLRTLLPSVRSTVNEEGTVLE